MSYTGRLASNDKVFDSTEGKDPISFELGAGLVIAGWEQGIPGMCPGQAVRLTIPPGLAYGEDGTVIQVLKNMSEKMAMLQQHECKCLQQYR